MRRMDDSGGAGGSALRALAIVPARLDSTRLPRKMLLRETGRYLFEHTVRNVERSSRIERVVLATDSEEIRRRLESVRQKLDEARAGDDQRLIRSLTDSLATQELRLDNHQKAERNAEFVAIELDRLEGKIQTLSEMAVNRQDPDFISREVDSVAESMHHTEAAISELSLVDGLIEDLAEPPPILEADLGEVMEK